MWVVESTRAEVGALVAAASSLTKQRALLTTTSTPCERKITCNLCSTSCICWVEAAGGQARLGIPSLETEEPALAHPHTCRFEGNHGLPGPQASGVWARTCQENAMVQKYNFDPGMFTTRLGTRPSSPDMLFVVLSTSLEEEEGAGYEVLWTGRPDLH